MEPIIYQLNTSNENDLVVQLNNIVFDIHPNPKLIKLGFNNLGNKLDFMDLTSNSHYTAGINFDFHRNDEKSINAIANSAFAINNFNKSFAELWEIVMLFSLLKKSNKIYSNTNVATDITTCYNKMYSANATVSKTIQNASLVLQRFSDVDLDENVMVKLLLKDLPQLLSNQNPETTMVLQIFNIQSLPMMQLIYYLSTLYESAYVYKPITVSEFSDNKYLVLIKLREKVNLVIKQNTDLYVASLYDTPIPENIISTIQCLNSKLTPIKFKLYKKIKTYLQEQVYEGATYNDMIAIQNSNTKKWIDLFTLNTNYKQILDEAIVKSSAECDHQQFWNSIYPQ